MRKFIYKYFIFFLVIFSSIVALPRNVFAVTDGSFDFVVPNGGNLVQGCSYSMDLLISSGSNESNSADIIINYNPANIEIIDSNLNKAGKQIRPGVAYQAYTGNQINEGTGEIRLTGFSLDENFTGTAIFATIEFKIKPTATSGAFNIAFDGASPTNTYDSNIAIQSSNLDALGSVTNANFTISPGSCIADTVPPNINFINPVSGQTGVPTGQVVLLNLTDNLSGVNLSTLEVLVNGVPYSINSPELQASGSTNNYNITLNQNNNIYPNSPSSILVNVSDYAGNVRQSYITFNQPLPPTPTPTSIPTQNPTQVPTSAPTQNPTANPTQGATGTPQPPITIYVTVTVTPPPTSPVPTSSPNIPTVPSTPNPTPTPNPDLIPPTIDFVNPISRETIGNEEEIVIRLKDIGVGVNLNSVQILVNERRYTRNDSTVTIEGIPNDYIFRIKDKFNYSRVSSSYLSVFVADLASNSTVNNIIFNIPQAVIEEEKGNLETICVPSDGTVASFTPPLNDNFKDLQKSVVNNAPDVLKPVVKEAGVFGLASFIATMPLVLWGASILGSFAVGGLLLPFFAALLFSKSKKHSRVINELTKEGVGWAKIKVYSGDILVKKIVANYEGRFYLKLQAGEYKINFEKDNYYSKEFKLKFTEETEAEEIFELVEIESKDIATQFQFKVFNLDPKIISAYFGLAFAVVNIIYVRTWTSIILLIVMILIAIFIKSKSRKPITTR